MVLRMTLSLFYFLSYDLFFTGVAMLDFDELQELPKISSSATKSDFICGLMGCNKKKVLSPISGLSPWQLYYHDPLER